MSSGGVTTVCYDATGFSCAGAGYNGTSGQIGGYGWTTGQYWSAGSPAANGARHNCTTYAAFRLQHNAYHYPGWTNNANGWDTSAWNANPRVNVDQTPAVGAIAQWNGGKAGHVAYVELVTSSYIETTSDSYQGGTDHQRIALNSAYRPDNFIHFKDQNGLWFIKTKNVGSGHVEVHSRTAASGYQSGVDVAVNLSPGDASNGWFQMAGSKG